MSHQTHSANTTYESAIHNLVGLPIPIAGTFLVVDTKHDPTHMDYIYWESYAQAQVPQV